LLRIQVISHELTEVKQSAMSALKTYKTRRTEKVPMFDQDGRLKGHKEVTAEEIQTFPGADHNSAVRALAERRQLEEFRLRIGTLFYDRDKGSGLEDLQEDERARLLHQAAQLFGSVPLDVADPYSVAGQVEGIAQAQDIGDGLGSTKAERRENLAALLEEPEQEGDAE